MKHRFGQIHWRPVLSVERIVGAQRFMYSRKTYDMDSLHNEGFQEYPSHHSRSFPNFPPAWIHSNDEWRNANTNWRLFWFRIRVVHPSPLFWYKDPTLGWCWMDLCQRWLTHTHFWKWKLWKWIQWCRYHDTVINMFFWLTLKKKGYILGTS